MHEFSPQPRRRDGANWIGLLARRVVAHFFVGALVTAIFGAIFIGAGGALIGWILDSFRTPTPWSSPDFLGGGLIIGAYTGALGGFVGAFFYGWKGFVAPPSRTWLPTRALIRNAVLGQFAGTLLACISFFLFDLVKARLTGTGFGDAVDNDWVYIFCGAPALMLIGLAIGAFWERNRA